MNSLGMLVQTQWERETGLYRRNFGTVAMSDSFAFGTFVPRKPLAASFSELSPTASSALAFKEKRVKRKQVGPEQLAQPASPSSFPNLAVLPAA